MKKWVSSFMLYFYSTYWLFWFCTNYHNLLPQVGKKKQPTVGTIIFYTRTDLLLWLDFYVQWFQVFYVWVFELVYNYLVFFIAVVYQIELLCFFIRTRFALYLFSKSKSAGFKTSFRFTCLLVKKWPTTPIFLKLPPNFIRAATNFLPVFTIIKHP